MELVAHMRSASETRAEPGDLSRENDFAAGTKTSMMAFPVAVRKGWAFVLQYPTESVGFLGSFWMWCGLGGLHALSDTNGCRRGCHPVMRYDARGCPDASAQCLLRSDARALSRV